MECMHSSTQHEACFASQLEVASLLLASGANPNAPGHSSEAALHIAVRAGNHELIKVRLSVFLHGRMYWFSVSSR
jgi:ankyrin repeat protein